MEPGWLSVADPPRLTCFKLHMLRAAIDAVGGPGRSAAVPQLIHRNVGLAAAGNYARRGYRQSYAGAGRWTTKPTMEGFMSPATQAFIMTAELFVLSFAAIFAFWFADKLRRNFFGQP